MPLEPFKILIGRLSAPEANVTPTASHRPIQHQQIQHQPAQHQPAHRKVGQGLQSVLQRPVHLLQAPQHLLAQLPAPVQALVLALVTT